MKERCLPGGLNYPMLEEYDFRNDDVNAPLPIELKPVCFLEVYLHSRNHGFHASTWQGFAEPRTLSSIKSEARKGCEAARLPQESLQFLYQVGHPTCPRPCMSCIDPIDAQNGW